MSKKIGDKKVGRVKANEIKATETAAEVKGTESVSSVSSVKATSAISGSRAAGGVARRSTRIISPQEREQLFRMVTEEAEKMFPHGQMSADRRQTLTEAVKMAISAGIVSEEESRGAGEKKKE